MTVYANEKPDYLLSLLMDKETDLKLKIVFSKIIVKKCDAVANYKAAKFFDKNKKIFEKLSSQTNDYDLKQELVKSHCQVIADSGTPDLNYKVIKNIKNCDKEIHENAMKNSNKYFHKRYLKMHKSIKVKNQEEEQQK